MTGFDERAREEAEDYLDRSEWNGSRYDTFLDGAHWGRAGGIAWCVEQLRKESLRCNEPDPVRTGLEWADWLEERKPK